MSAGVAVAARSAWAAVSLAVNHVRALPSTWRGGAACVFVIGALFVAIGVYQRLAGTADAAVSAAVVVAAMGLTAAVSIVASGAMLARLEAVRWFASASVFTTSITMGMFVSIPWEGAGGLVGFAFVPAVVGTWFAAAWTRKLYDAGVRGAALVEATTTVRGLSVAWALIMGAVLVTWLASLVHLEIGLDGLLGDGLAGLVGVASTVAYAGTGYTEYRKAIEGST